MAIRASRPHPLARNYPRTTGLFALLIGSVVFYFSIVEPILHAKVGEVVKLSGKGGLGGFIVILAGLAHLVFGSRMMEWNNSSAERSPKFALILGGIFAIIAIIAMELLKSYLRSKGYVL
jgi:hypothetical protein